MRDNLKSKEKTTKTASSFQNTSTQKNAHADLKIKSKGQISILKPLVDYLFSLEKNDRRDFVLNIRLKQLSQNALGLQESASLQKDEIEKNSLFLGTLAKCAIPGCDVHTLDNNLEMAKHYDKNEQIEMSFIEARKVIKKIPDSAIAILVFNDHLEILHADGTHERI